jgi:hypothetical protein
MSGAETQTMSTEPEEELQRSDSPDVRTALRDPQRQIRLLLLDAGIEEDDISASLEVWDRTAAPTYRAISYVCGDSDHMQDVTFNGSRVSVRHNCHYALWQARLHFPESRVWIDAVCINQLDLEEKTAQVTMMSETYAGAVQVLAGIGPSDEHSDVVLRAANDIKMLFQLLAEDRYGMIDKNDWELPLDETAGAQFVDHYNEFSMRPYFTRVWVLQELAAGQPDALLLCGPETSHWHDLVYVMYAIHRLWVVYGGGPDGPFENRLNCRIQHIDMVISMRESNYPSYLRRTRELQCQDIRDRVYSTSVLVDWSSFGQKPPVPDYQISPLELALQLIGKMVNLNLDHIVVIAETLGLLNPSTMSQVLDELKTRRLVTNSSQALEVSHRKWYAPLDKAQMVQQDLTGRPSVHTGYGITTWEHSSGLSGDTLASSELYGANRYDASIVAARKRVRPGDIFVCSWYFNLVLRPDDDGDKFVVVSNVWPEVVLSLKKRAPFVAECDCHLCLLQTIDECETEDVKVAIELSHEEALAAVINREAESISMDARLTSARTGLIPEYDFSWCLRSGHFGTSKVGSHAWDVTMEKMRHDHSVKMGRPPCVTHRAGDYYWKHQKFLWYSVLMGTGTKLTFPKQGRS